MIWDKIRSFFKKKEPAAPVETPEDDVPDALADASGETEPDAAHGEGPEAEPETESTADTETAGGSEDDDLPNLDDYVVGGEDEPVAPSKPKNMDDDFLAKLLADAEIDQPEEEIAAPEGTDLDDMDSELERMLAKDQAESADFDVFAGVDETEEDAEPRQRIRVVKQDKKTIVERLTSMTFRQMAFVAGGLVLIILLAVLTAVFLPPVIRARQEAEMLVAHYKPITVPVNTANNANYIFRNDTVLLDDVALTLNKIAIGSAGTFFYFDQPFDPDAYGITLHDQQQTQYHRYLNDFTFTGEGGTVLKFEPFSNTTVFFTLTLRNKETLSLVTFDYRFENMPSLSSPVYVDMPVAITDDGDGLQIVFENAVFSNTGSEIVYALLWENGARSLRSGEDGGMAGLVLRDGAFKVVSDMQQPLELLFGTHNVTLGRMTFAPVRDLHNTVEAVFHDLFYVFNVPSVVRVDVAALYAYQQRGPQKLRVGNYIITLEAMATQGDLVVLVLNGQDLEGNRVETRITADLLVETSSGTVVIPGESHAAKAGTDVLFDVSAERGRMFGVPLSQYAMRIKTVEIRLPEVAVSIDLSEHGDRTDRQRATAESAVIEAFKSRLSYKSQTIALWDIVGFSDALINDRLLMRFYTPTATQGTPRYTVAVTAGVLLDTDTFLAVVEESWMVVEGDEWTAFDMTHQVVAERRDNTWVIVSDEEMAVTP